MDLKMVSFLYVMMLVGGTTRPYASNNHMAQFLTFHRCNYHPLLWD